MFLVDAPSEPSVSVQAVTKAVEKVAIAPVAGYNKRACTIWMLPVCRNQDGNFRGEGIKKAAEDTATNSAARRRCQR